MKKLVFAFTIALAVISANAATYTWKATSGYLYDGTGGSAEENKITSGIAYLFNTSYSQSTLLAAIVAGTSLENIAKANAVNYNSGSFVGGTVGSNARIAQSEQFTYTGVEVGNSWSAYFAIVSGDKVYISAAKSGIDASEIASGTDITMGAMSTNSKLTIGDASSGYSDAGWYSVAVPEPTSGMLLMLGVGLMALKRKVKKA